ncbi:hypothetical protein SAMN02745146_1840 [Hymenobacter daecheongensis DSM 21074]|uniref:Lipoprotein n=1 Tax=Hymenobacter daecheongensis DSM 21074 TaxID=1121955 RepID=A0A1M6EW43_9BACT|nr:hypothetical protein [Hymenobacter daecheongensis]SHI89707.1 hypothetical protein SAMN02745146_1840 [Hymenobacter daecheongensis DSM 21074]
MKSASQALLAAALCMLATGCNQTPPAAEQAGTAPAASTAPAPAAPDSAAPAAAAPAATPAETAPAAPAAQAVKVSFRFKPGAAAEGPEGPKTNAFLVLQGAKNQDIDLGQFTGKPDVVNKEKAKLAGFPSAMLLGFRSYDPGSGTSQDLAVLNVGGRQLRIVQRRLEENAEKMPEFQTSRELDLPANAVVEVVPAAKK